MKLNNITKCFAAASILTAPLAFADNIDGSISFTTVPDVSIIQLQALDFGTDMSLGLNHDCTLLVTGDTDFPSQADAGISDSVAASTAAAATFQTRTNTGNGCDDTGTGTAGIYEVTGGAGVPVKITLNSVSGTNFNFAPTGAVGDYDGEPTADGDLFVDLDADAVTPATLANTNDVVNAVTGGAPQAGKTKIFVGGELTATTTLVAGTTYTETFTIEVTY